MRITVVLLMFLAWGRLAATEIRWGYGSNFTAMCYELRRNHDSLQIDGTKPFVIMARMTEGSSLSIQAQKGKIAYSNSVPYFNRTYISLLTGDYHRTQLRSFHLFSETNRVQLPLEMDSEATRIATWLSLDMQFKQALYEYPNKMQGLSKRKLPKEELDLPELYAPVPKVLHTAPQELVWFDRTKWEAYLRTASAVFNEFPQIERGSLTLEMIRGARRIYSTEGVEVSQPMEGFVIRGSLNLKDSLGVNYGDYFSLEGDRIQDLPSLDSLRLHCRAVAKQLTQLPSLPPFDDVYLGPIWFEGAAALSILQYIESSNSSRRSFSLSAPRPDYGRMDDTMERLIGKPYYAPQLTLTDHPALRSYGGQRLMGGYEVDDEGVEAIPLRLIENGVLRTLYAGRFPTLQFCRSNGHFRAGLFMPSNLHFSFRGGKPVARLRKEFIAQGRKEGYRYLYLIDGVYGVTSQAVIRRLDLQTGEERRFRDANIEELRVSQLRAIRGTASEERVYHNADGFYSANPWFCSYIVPQAVIVDNLELTKSQPRIPEEDYVVPRSRVSTR